MCFRYSSVINVLSICRDMVFCYADFKEHELNVSDEFWAKEAISAIGEMEKNEKS